MDSSVGEFALGFGAGFGAGLGVGFGRALAQVGHEIAQVLGGLVQGSRWLGTHTLDLISSFVRGYKQLPSLRFSPKFSQNPEKCSGWILRAIKSVERANFLG